jgi:glyoxylase-like metal-dependent hydrolase (beta-lactamase superfamily II)
MPMFSLGDAQIDSALEQQLSGRPITSLGADPALIEANRWWLAPHFLEPGDCWSLDFRSWIVRVDGKVVVIDPCNGNDRPHVMPMFDQLQVPFLERFEATGTRIDEVDYVFCTHLHHDHCGWNTMLKDGRWVPTFPNARYLFVQREYERWHPDNAARFPQFPYNEGVYERAIAPVVAAGQADLVQGSHRLSESLCLEPGHGHTFDHTMLHIASRGAEALFTGDAFHHPLQLIDPTIMFGDRDDDAGVIATRQRLVRRSLEHDWLLIAAHLPYPHAGRMRDGERGLWFEAI